MKLIASTVVIVVVINLCSSLTLPKGFTKCDKRRVYFDDCLSHAIRDAIKQLEKPIPEYGLPGLGPLVFPRPVEIGNSTIGLKQTYSNVKLSLSKIIDAKAKMNFETDTLNVDISLEEFGFNADAHITGNLLILPLDSKTEIYGSFKKPIFKFTFSLDKHVKDNNQHYKLTKTDIDLVTDGLEIGYKHIFQNEALNDALNAELKASSKTIYDYLWGKYSVLLGQLFGGIFGNLLDKVPLNELFDG